jgi:hypothetical protein
MCPPILQLALHQRVNGLGRGGKKGRKVTPSPVASGMRERERIVSSGMARKAQLTAAPARHARKPSSLQRDASK